MVQERSDFWNSEIQLSIFFLLSNRPWSLLSSEVEMLQYTVALCLLAVSWAQDCQVANIQVMQNFDKARVSGQRDLHASFDYGHHLKC